jgi:adhesin transport system outer membrane protein
MKFVNLLRQMLILGLLGAAPVFAQEARILDIRSALREAVTEHPALRGKRSEIAAAQSDVSAAKWQYWPTPSVGISRPDKALIKGTDASVSTVALKQPLWAGGRIEASVAYAKARSQTTQVIYEEVRRDLALETIQAWGEYCSASARVEAYGNSLLAHLNFLRQIQRRTKSGLSVQSDNALASSRLDAVKADLTSARAAMDSASERLRTLMGQSPAVGAELPDALTPQSGAEDEVQLALQIDPGLQRLQSEIQEIKAQIDSAKSNYWPELSASVSQRQGDVTGKVNQVAIGFESKWGAGLSNSSAVQAALQRLDAKQEEVEYRTRKLTEQIRADRLQLQASRTRVQTYRQALESAKSVANSWDRQFAAGKKSWQEVMNAARESTQTEIQLLDAISTTAVIDWRLAVLTRGVDWVLQSPKASQ